MLFSSSWTLPESISDIKSMGTTIEMAGVDRCVIVADKGFYSNEYIRKLKKNHLSYIILLKRSSLEHSWTMANR